MLDGKLKCWEPSAWGAVEKTLRTVGAKRETRTVFITEKLYQRMEWEGYGYNGGKRRAQAALLCLDLEGLEYEWCNIM